MSTSFLPYHFFLKIHLLSSSFSFFFFNDPATTEIYPLPLPAALPISLLSLVFAVGLGLSLSTTAMVARRIGEKDPKAAAVAGVQAIALGLAVSALERLRPRDRKSTRLNSSHDQISYAVFCLKKKTRLVGGRIVARAEDDRPAGGDDGISPTRVDVFHDQTGRVAAVGLDVVDPPRGERRDLLEFVVQTPGVVARTCRGPDRRIHAVAQAAGVDVVAEGLHAAREFHRIVREVAGAIPG